MALSLCALQWMQRLQFSNVVATVFCSSANDEVPHGDLGMRARSGRANQLNRFFVHFPVDFAIQEGAVPGLSIRRYTPIASEKRSHRLIFSPARRCRTFPNFFESYYNDQKPVGILPRVISTMYAKKAAFKLTQFHGHTNCTLKWFASACMPCLCWGRHPRRLTHLWHKTHSAVTLSRRSAREHRFVED